MNLLKQKEGFDKTDRYFMAIALSEAKKGLGRTAPNPCVGAVIVRNGEEVSRGYHKKAGTPHAEVHALNGAGDKACGATAYVTLEPCNHTGRTPPCSHALAAAGIKRVVVGMTDPNPLVSGSGNQYLIDHGIEVITGVLEDECRELNLPFIKHITTGTPFVIMKAGMSLDGKLSYQKGVPGKMTGAESLARLHMLRDSVDAILIGRGTLLADNPSLTTRASTGGRDPVRVVLDSSLQISPDSKILHLDSEAKTMLICAKQADSQKVKMLSSLKNVQVHRVKQQQGGGLDLESILHLLGKTGICSLLVEGGAEVHTSFLKHGLVDRVMLFMAPLFAGTSGTGLLCDFIVSNRQAAPMLHNVIYTPLGDDILIQGDIA